MAPKRQKSALARTSTNNDASEATTRKNEKFLNTSKASGNTQDRSSPSGEDDDFEEDEDDEDDDEDEEDDEEEEDDDDEEEDEGVEDNGGFDEKFLAQLMAMDPIFSNKAGQSAVSSQKAFETSTNGTASSTNKDDSVSTRQLTSSHGTPFPNMPAYASAASTPSNEFYDGAINFLTEVLGSSDPSMWNGAETQQSQNGWNSEQFSTVQPAASPAPTQAQFKNLQPLIGNLIARLKGQPVEESEQGPRVLEDDLVVLLQSLMAQRQAQEERKNIQKSDKGQKGITPRTDVQRQQAQTPQQPAISQPNSGFPTMDEINALAASFPILPNTDGTTNANSTQQPQTGFSIVDFDFGDDDDDPDFVPNNFNLSQPFGESSQALAQALADANDQNGDAWQQMMSSFGNANPSAVGTGMATNLPMSPAGEARRTRSVSKNVDSQTLNSASLKQLDHSLQPPNTMTEDSREEGTSTTHESEEGNTKGKKRRIFTTEEALERRREANRECARRQRAKKKEETEAIRKELERIQALGIGGTKTGSENIIDVTQALVGRRRRGRPLGSRNRRTMEDMKRYSEEVEQETEMSDLRADNRMLRAEMHRLQEENAKLRANALRHEEVMQMMGEHDLIKNQERRSGKRMSYGNRPSHNEGSPIHDSLDEGDDLPNDLSNTQDPAGDFLAYNPFRTFQRVTNGNSYPGRNSVNAHTSSSLRRQDQHNEPSRRGVRENQRAVPGHQAIHHQQQSSRGGNPSNSLQDLLQAAATEMGGYDYT